MGSPSLLYGRDHDDANAPLSPPAVQSSYNSANKKISNPAIAGNGVNSSMSMRYGSHPCPVSPCQSWASGVSYGDRKGPDARQLAMRHVQPGPPNLSMGEASAVVEGLGRKVDCLRPWDGVFVLAQGAGGDGVGLEGSF